MPMKVVGRLWRSGDLRCSCSSRRKPLGVSSASAAPHLARIQSNESPSKCLFARLIDPRHDIDALLVLVAALLPGPC